MFMLDPPPPHPAVCALVLSSPAQGFWGRSVQPPLRAHWLHLHQLLLHVFSGGRRQSLFQREKRGRKLSTRNFCPSADCTRFIWLIESPPKKEAFKSSLVRKWRAEKPTPGLENSSPVLDRAVSMVCPQHATNVTLWAPVFQSACSYCSFLAFTSFSVIFFFMGHVELGIGCRLHRYQTALLLNQSWIGFKSGL